MIEVLALDDSPTRSPIYFPRGPQLEGSDEIFDMLARAFFRRADQPIRQHARGETGTLTAEPANSGLFGTPQGGPLSPLLSNLMLDVLDKELETRGLNFVRYADDCNIYVRSQRAGERVMASIERFLNRRLKLKVNKAKSAVARPSKRKFLGFGFMTGRQPRRRIAPQSLARFRSRVRELTRRTRGRSLAQIVKELSVYLTGWRGYFGFCETPSVLRNLDQRTRRRLRAIVWKQWKRGPTRFAELRRCGDFKSFDEIVDHCCYAWNTLIDQPWKIMSIARRDWAVAGHSL
jgi:hypothetical protein